MVSQRTHVRTSSNVIEQSTVKSRFNGWPPSAPFYSLIWNLRLSRLFFNVKFHFRRKISFLKSRLYIKSRFVKSRLYCTFYELHITSDWAEFYLDCHTLVLSLYNFSLSCCGGLSFILSFSPPFYLSHNLIQLPVTKVTEKIFAHRWHIFCPCAKYSYSITLRQKKFYTYIWAQSQDCPWCGCDVTDLAFFSLILIGIRIRGEKCKNGGFKGSSNSDSYSEDILCYALFDLFYYVTTAPEMYVNNSPSASLCPLEPPDEADKSANMQPKKQIFIREFIFLFASPSLTHICKDKHTNTHLGKNTFQFEFFKSSHKQAHKNV